MDPTATEPEHARALEILARGHAAMGLGRRSLTALERSHE